MQRDLIDEYSLCIHPIVLGDGKRMFSPLRDKMDLQHVEMHTFGSSVVLLKYRRQGKGH